MEKSGKAPKPIDEYISLQPVAIQKLLRKIRTAIKKAAPDAEEKISYQMPTFAQNGNLVHFAAFKDHIGFFPAPSGKAAFEKELANYKGGKGTVQFPLGEPIPFDLIGKIVRFRVTENNTKKAVSKRQ